MTEEFDPPTKWLYELRREVKISQKEAARYFGMSRYDSIGAWENNQSRPDSHRRERFIYYLWDLLKLKREPEIFVKVWKKIVVSHWNWLPLSEPELPSGCPVELLESDTVTVPLQMPHTLPYFVGRKTELRALRRKIRKANKATLFSLQGPPGVGKSAMAIQLAHDLRNHFKDGILWARFGLESTSVMDVLDKFARAYGVDLRNYQDLSVRRSTLREILISKQALIILDDVTNSDEVRAFLPAYGASIVLITTRRQDLTITHKMERIYVQPFDEEADEAFQLFKEILEKEFNVEDKAILTQIASLLGHLPLAIAIAASRLAFEPDLSYADLLTRLQDEKQRLTELEIENESVRASFNQSHRLLDDVQARHFAALGIYNGRDFDTESLAAILESPLYEASRNLRLLYKLSLLQAESHGRYRLHPLLNDFSREKLAQEGNAQWASYRARYINYYLDFTIRHEKNLVLIERELAHIREAIQAAHLVKPEIAAESIVRLAHFQETRGLYAEAITNLDKAVKIANELNDDVLLARIKVKQGRIAKAKGKIEVADVYFMQALPLINIQEHPDIAAATFEGRGIVAARQGQLQRAEELFTSGLNLARAAGDIELEINMLQNLGAVANILKIFDHAEELLQKGLNLAEEHKIHERIITILSNLASVENQRGNFQKAKELLNQAYEKAEQQNHLENQIFMLTQLGGNEIDLNNLSQAREYLLQAYAKAQSFGNPETLARVLRNLGELECLEENYEAADNYFMDAFTLAGRIKDVFMLNTVFTDWQTCVNQRPVASLDVKVLKHITEQATEFGVSEHIGWVREIFARLEAPKD